ncbi:SMODS domain-containing nucleotidyltransferase [Paraliomyxa miuraensis]|uniref:SMODS domain-containing nucleotidyltransferase n=1 Tax=Paraliomyxa miuraensis TaxID=376150 RepID=UPI00225A9808|nr:nucleotidyltransferase domain-containing protein [Paraliomyxa miuraensis]MCX4242512.1 nucleotidyltransferase domain-containing protein [Paraliomyxa miuraensis]
MMTIPQTFQSFLSSLELTTKQRKEANEQHIRLRIELQKRMKVEDNFLSGSYARKTAIRPLGDIDVFVVFERRPGFDPTIPIPTILGEVKRVLDQAFPSKSALSQNRSVNIEFSGTGIAYDVVPAFSSRPGVYMVPDRETGRWVKTNPKIHAELATQANERAGKKLKPLLKAVKHANVHHRKLARSFHLEVLSWKILTRDPGPYLDGLVALLQGLAQRIDEPCIDPANLGPDIRPEPDRCRAAKEWLGRMAKLAAEAKVLDDAKQATAAHAKLRQIFGDQWR